MESTAIAFFNIKILEPSTFVSDMILGLSCFLFYKYIQRISKTKAHRNFSYFFLFMALSGFIGAFGHSLFLYTGKTLQCFGWLMSGIGVYFIENGFFSRLTGEFNKRFFSRFIRAKLLLFALIILISMNFLFVKINTAFGLIVMVAPFLIIKYFGQGSKNYLYILSGIFLAIIPALLHSLKLKLDSWMQMNDINHYFLIVCFFLIYLGLKGVILDDLKIESDKV